MYQNSEKQTCVLDKGFNNVLEKNSALFLQNLKQLTLTLKCALYHICDAVLKF